MAPPPATAPTTPLAAPARAPGDADPAQRQRRYQEAQAHELVRDLVKRFDADIVARELLPPDAP